MQIKHFLKSIAITGILVVSFAIKAQTNSNQDILKNQKQMDYKVNIGKIDVPKTSIEEFRKQAMQTPAYLEKLPGFIKGEYYEMTDNLGGLHMISIVTWKNSEYYENAQVTLKKHYDEIHFNRSEFVKRLGLTIKYDAYSVLKMN